MTRTSWHCFWMLLMFAAIVLCVVCFLLVFEPVPFPIYMGKGVVAALIGLQVIRFVNELTVVAAYFWGFTAITSGLGWWACAMALRGRRRYLAWEKRIDERFGALAREKGIQLGVRD